MNHVRCMESITVLFYNIPSLQNILSLIMYDEVLKLIPETSFIRDAHPLYATPSPLDVFLGKIFLVRTICHVRVSYFTYDLPASHPHGNSTPHFS